MSNLYLLKYLIAIFLYGDQLAIDAQRYRKFSIHEKYQGQIFINLIGGPRSQAVTKFPKLLRWIDGGIEAYLTVKRF